MSHGQGRGAARGSGALLRAANMAGVADAAAPGSGGDGRRGGAPEQQDTGRGEPKTLWGSSEPRPPAAGPGQPSPQQRTETLGFYESDRDRKKKRSLSGERAAAVRAAFSREGRVAGSEVRGAGSVPTGDRGGRRGVAPGRATPPGRVASAGSAQRRPARPAQEPRWVPEAGLRAPGRPPGRTSASDFKKCAGLLAGQP